MYACVFRTILRKKEKGRVDEKERHCSSVSLQYMLLFRMCPPCSAFPRHQLTAGSCACGWSQAHRNFLRGHLY